ncbi:hypothetical protein SNEBB_003701 [Seison nebaliae]|nr:hypothetical protein SNEBB_003701 [Seison nebaliae]
MGTIFRGEEMTLCHIYLQPEAAYNCVSELGECGIVQFRDMNPDLSAFQRKYINELRRCDEMERKLRYFKNEIDKEDIQIVDIGEYPPAPHTKDMIDLESTLEKLELELKEVNKNYDMLRKNYSELIEMKHILRKTQLFFSEGSWQDSRALNFGGRGTDEVHRHFTPTGDDGVGLLDDEYNDTNEGGLIPTNFALRFVAGVIQTDRLPTFERMLWRVCHGNVFLRHAEIEEKLTVYKLDSEGRSEKEDVWKSVFIIFFQGAQLKNRVKKICEGFQASIYPCPEVPTERKDMSMDVLSRLEDMKTVVQKTEQHRNKILTATAKNLMNWQIRVRKIKAIYHVLNLFNMDVGQKCLLGEAWAPCNELDRITYALRIGSENSGSTLPSMVNRIPSHEQPPTYYRTNKITDPYQNIVDAYGIGSYREMNPTPFIVITFPFIFAIMFGDLGHGLLLTVIALILVLGEKKFIAKRIKSEVWNIVFSGRYILLLMGVFSMYTGLLYNETFARPIKLASSSWRVDFDDKFINENPLIQLDPAPISSANATMYSGASYAFGIDPLWQLSTNKILFTNSLKMKLSIIFGVTHMVFGLMLSLLNHLHFDQKDKIYLMFIPECLFLSLLFVYLCILMFYKWLRFDGTSSPINGAGCAPSLLIHLINMFMMTYATEPCSVAPFYRGQKHLQNFFVIIAMSCIPLLLFGRPYYLYRKNKISERKGTVLSEVPIRNPNEGEVLQMMIEDEEEHAVKEEKFDLSDILVHQAIHTIEYCLGCVSHTASYLRLWALSLAHAQLAEVMWVMVLRIGFQINSILGSVVLMGTFAFWAVLSVGILLFMEGLSAFLHALRLHWIEFQSKFYKGEGHKFEPFSFYTYPTTDGVDQ